MSTPPGLVAITVLTGIFGVFLALLLVLDKLKPSQGAGWGPLGFQFPREWALVWIGYWFMLVFTIFVFPFIMAGLPGFGVGEDARPICSTRTAAFPTRTHSDARPISTQCPTPVPRRSQRVGWRGSRDDHRSRPLPSLRAHALLLVPQAP